MEYSYDAWGKLLSTTGSMADTIGQKNPFLYRGYYYDFETGMYYLNSRYYDPNTGRFLNADGQFNPDTGLAGNNLFAYCNNDPINASDYNGARFTESDDGSGRWVNYVNNRMYSGTGRPITGGANSSTKNNSVVQSLNNRKPGKAPHVGWPKLPPDLGGKNQNGIPKDTGMVPHGGRYTWDTFTWGRCGPR
ncbi:RHS repeat-associated core domain-containing protein [Caproiciproducens sp. R1]|uniref:RHS repeat-associated core domain-containing protein n=1 Tax=Caproiciproducens sp. R1 TaxID=3435000 RepID=UPI004034671D